MDVSQLCSSPADSTPFPPSLNNRAEMDKTPTSHRRTPGSLDFILSPYDEPRVEQQQQRPKLTDPPTSNEVVFDQCSKLCETIWQLKLQHKDMSFEERDLLINNLSTSAQQLFKTIQSSEQWTNKDNTKKRDFNSNSIPNYDEEEDEDEEDEEDEEEEERLNNDTLIKDHAEYELIRQARNLQDTHSRPKYRRRNRRSMIGQKCHSCSTTETPEWRRGPDGARTLCNACGLHYSKLLRKGSIVVQTQNYLLACGIPPQTPSIVSATAISNNSKTNPSPSLVNFPFVLMDPKNDKKQILPADTSSSTTYTQPNVNSSPSQSPAPSSKSQQQQLPDPSKNSSGNQNTITPLRIHQWKQH